MPRFRRYRVFLISAILLTILVVRLSKGRQWEDLSTPGLQIVWEGYKDEAKSQPEGFSSSQGESKRPAVDIEKIAHSGGLLELTSAVVQTVASVEPSLTPTATVASPNLALGSIIPDRKPVPPTQVQAGQDDIIHAQAPGRVEPFSFSTTPSPIHWQKQIEHFPVPTESIIQLPTGTPVAIPKIQFAFSDETPSAKVKREERLGKVKVEFQRAWKGYKTHAWMHDELSPETGLYRDPFCGWAATLVDSLDTLWIMGLEEDFEEAVRAVGTIDFTTASRADIQVFETTIRYLGGLLAAYDVSGGIKTVLLDKAVELAEILMGAFDTPNRMPLLFYRWKPAFASQPHRASARSNLAELGTLSMEFTRLAQLTKEAKYYDAVARITNALEEWQTRGTGLTGVFPSDVDTSGCNRSIPVISNGMPSGTPIPDNTLAEDGEGYKVPMPKTPREPKPKKKPAFKEANDIELTVIPGEPSTAQLGSAEKVIGNMSPRSQKVSRRAESPEFPESPKSLSNAEVASEAILPTNKTLEASKVSEFARDHSHIPDSELGDWDCVPQGLDSANFGQDSFSMGGGQDSTYEYFPKEYLLLGGLEDKYRTMYQKAMDAVREHMLYRPMIPDNSDILFSGRVLRSGSERAPMLEAEVTHLTCFIGGMVGMGAKIFNIEHDLAIAEKLTDGCVWAYESMRTGIMAETAQLVSCGSVIDCHWNETLWLETLDPNASRREKQIEEYDLKRANREAKLEQERLAEQSLLDAEGTEGSQAAASDPLQSNGTGSDAADVGEPSGVNADVDVDSTPPKSTRYEDADDDPMTTDGTAKSGLTIKKRQASKGMPTAKFVDATTLDDSEIQNEQFQRKLKDTELELQAAAPGREVKKPSEQVPQIPTPGEIARDPQRPLTHKEYVDAKIEREDLVPGYVRIQSNRYILRPEAIESVWYMYRITGETKWQDKGWNMFEHIINATSTTYGHTAIRGVSGNETQALDQMESFWLAETLKYFYLLYSTPDVISLDDWVLNTEAHPFLRPKYL